MSSKKKLENILEAVTDTSEMTREEIKRELAEEGIDLDAAEKRFAAFLKTQERQARWRAFKARVAELTVDQLQERIEAFPDVQVSFRGLKKDLARADLERLLFDIEELGEN